MKRAWAWICRGRMSLRIVPLLLGVSILSFAGGCLGGSWQDCEPLDDCDPPELPAGTQSCDLHSFEGSPEGICIPHVDAGWHTALVRMVPKEEGKPDCPATAEWAGLVGEEITDGSTEPRYVIACSVIPIATCTSLSWACVPFEEGYPACVLQIGPEECPSPYLEETRVAPEDGGDAVMVCCREPRAPS